ncbi:MAG: WD40 repeat domain-containing protein [Gemmataceae bacterium]|nr:WD40 repeat domain-containing protein [Gemmataceae bacterium]
MFDKATLAWTLPWQDDWVTAVTFIGNTRKLAAGNRKGQILLWDLPEKPSGDAPVPVRRLDGHTNEVTRLLSTPDGKYLISASYDHSIRIWDMEAKPAGNEEIILDARTRAEVAKKAGSKAPPPAPGVKVDVQPAERVVALHKEWVLGLSMSRDGATLLSGDDAGEVVLWNRAEAKETRRWRIKGWAFAVAVSPDAQLALVSERFPLVFTPADQRNAVKIWDLTTGQVKHDLSAQFKMYIGSAAFSPDGKQVVIGHAGETERGKLFLIDAETGKKVREYAGHMGGITDVQFSADGKFLLSTGRDTVVRVWNVEDTKQVAELGKSRGGQFKDFLHALALTEDQRWLAAGDMVGQVLVYSA